jgi:LmbE family N-acetylglucosaminyl deacetylase
VTVWYATPEVTELQCDQARVLLRALGTDLQVEDERFVEMATAVSGTGPAYVFLVMEALIDAAVHLGFPRHVAHDLVIETLEGSTAFAKATAQHPAVLRNMVTSPGGTSAAAIHETGVGPAPDGSVRGGLGILPADRRAGRGPREGSGLNEGQARDPRTATAANGARPAGRPRGIRPLTWRRQRPAPRTACSRSSPTPTTRATAPAASWPSPPRRAIRSGFCAPPTATRAAARAKSDVDHSLDPEIRRARAGLRVQGARRRRADLPRLPRLGHGGLGRARRFAQPRPQDEVVERILAVIRRLRPAVIVTFDPGGVYGHPDHTACSATATAAYRRAAAEPGGPVALYHQALPRSPWRDAGAQEAERRRSGDDKPPTEDDIRQQEAFVKLARPDEEITTVVPILSVAERKIAALACHDSQMRGRRWDDPEERAQMERMFGTETFVRVDPAPRSRARGRTGSWA